MCTLDHYQCWAVKPRLPAVVRELSWGILGRGEEGLKGIGVSGSGYNEVPVLGMLTVVDYVERGRYAKLLESASAPHPVVVVLSFQACLRAYMSTSTCACVWTCMYTYAQACMCACTCTCACARVRVHAHALHAHACARVCTDRGSWWWRLGVSGCVLGARAHPCACACMCTRICIVGFDDLG